MSIGTALKAITEQQLKDWFLALQSVLAEHVAFWRRSPFHDYTPSWATHHPALFRFLLALSSEEVTRLSQDNDALIEALVPWIPSLSTLQTLCEVSSHEAPTPGPNRFFTHVAGGKRAQVEAFASAAMAAGVGGRPWLEWCAGKGHLGRWLGYRTGLDVLSVEWSSTLCGAGRMLAANSGVDQVFDIVDVHTTDVVPRLRDRHVVALHACGDLHRRLIDLMPRSTVPALDLAPCCYDRTVNEVYEGLNPEADLAPDRLALRLSVTDMRAGRRREHLRTRRELGWKLAYKQMRFEYLGIDAAQPLASVPRSWARLSFPDWCRAMADRDGFTLSSTVDWHQWQQKGAALRRRFGRLNLPRLVFRRGLEMWIVLDLALHLVRQGYRVSVSTFCSRLITPRNLLISARSLH
ncbi:MAG: methyltransferase [Myxococcota bacterium]